MIVIIAGGRDYQMTDASHRWLDSMPIEGVVSGGAPGADRGAEAWARLRGIPVAVFKADWNEHGSAAGPIRNQKMANFLVQYPNRAVLLFPGGRGTNSMRGIANKMGITVMEFPG